MFLLFLGIDVKGTAKNRAFTLVREADKPTDDHLSCTGHVVQAGWYTGKMYRH